MNSYIKALVEKKGFLIAAHRGTFKANIAENSIASFNAAILEGADMVEIDLIESQDGVLYVFHDGGESRVFKEDIDIFTLTAAEIEQLRFHNQLDDKTSQKVITLRDYLDYISQVKVDFMINIDRCFKHFETLLPLLDEYDLQEKILIKAPIVKELEVLNQYKTKYMFMAILKTEADLIAIEKYEHINTVALELIVNDDLTYFDNKDLILKLKEKGYLIWLNSITLHDQAPLFYRYDDNAVITTMDFTPWKTLVSYHPDIIQTDWVAILDKFRKNEL